MTNEFTNSRQEKIEEVARLVRAAMKMINEVKHHPSLMDRNNLELQQAILDCNEQIAALKDILEEHFMEETESGFPASLSLRRAYEELQFL